MWQSVWPLAVQIFRGISIHVTVRHTCSTDCETLRFLQIRLRLGPRGRTSEATVLALSAALEGDVQVGWKMRWLVRGPCLPHVLRLDEIQVK